jgi:hypothetical protein
LTLVAGTVTIESKGGNVVFAGVLLRESETGPEGNLGTDDTVSSEKGRGEDVHGTALSVGHTVLATEKLSQDTLYCSTPQHREGVASV